MTYEQLMAESRRLAGEGRVEDARRVARIALSLLQSTNPNPAPGASGQADPQAIREVRQGLGDVTTGLAEGAWNGLSLGFGDNIDAAVMGGVLGGMPREDGGVSVFNYGTPTAERYSAMLGEERQRLEAARTAAPGSAAVGEIMGGLLPSLMVSPSLAGQSMGRQMATMGGYGAIEGALIGGGNADGEDTAMSALAGAGIGGSLGALAVPAAAGVRSVGDFLGGLGGVGQPARAARPIARAMTRAGIGPDDLDALLSRAAAEGQDVYTIADALGDPGQRLLAGVARSPGEGSAQIRAFLDSRQAGQNDRVAGFVNDALGLDTDTALQFRNAAGALRAATAAPNYDAARRAAVPVDVRSAVNAIDARLSPMRGAGIDGDGIDSVFARYRDRLANTLPNGQIELSDFNRVLGVKQNLQDDIQAAMRAGRNNEARELTSILRQLDGALEAASPPYRQANDIFAAQSQAIDAIDTGATAARGMRTGDALDSYNARTNPQLAMPTGTAVALPAGTSPGPYLPSTPRPPQMAPGTDQQAAFRVGFGDQLLRRGENVPPSYSVLRDFLTPKNTAMMETMSDDPALWASRLGREEDMGRTINMALRGSPTSERLQDVAEAGDTMMRIGEAITSPTRAAGRAVLSAVGNVAQGRDAETRALIARALLSRDPQAAIQPLLDQAARSARYQRAAEALIRHSGYVASQ